MKPRYTVEDWSKMFKFASNKRAFLAMIAKKEAWLVFDLDNGDEDKGYYVWWFPSRSQARKHIQWQKQKKNAASLSAPIKFTRKK